MGDGAEHWQPTNMHQAVLRANTRNIVKQTQSATQGRSTWLIVKTSACNIELQDSSCNVSYSHFLNWSHLFKECPFLSLWVCLFVLCLQLVSTVPWFRQQGAANIICSLSWYYTVQQCQIQLLNSLFDLIKDSPCRQAGQCCWKCFLLTSGTLLRMAILIYDKPESCLYEIRFLFPPVTTD